MKIPNGQLTATANDGDLWVSFITDAENDSEKTALTGLILYTLLTNVCPPGDNVVNLARRLEKTYRGAVIEGGGAKKC